MRPIQAKNYSQVSINCLPGKAIEDVEKEISEITKAIQNGEGAYKLKYNADVEDRTFGSPKLKKR